MFAVQGLDKYYGARAIIDTVSLTIGKSERVGLVGRNGCGKSTLLRILAGIDAPDRSGGGAIRHGLSIGYLPQHAEFQGNASVMETAFEGLSPGVQSWQVRKALLGLGLREHQFAQEARTLSGGEKTRLMLARLLLGEHDLLLLDEPTSHLDIEALTWLEEFLLENRGAYLVASHDRRFLDRCVSQVIELDEGKLTTFAGNYSAYALAKQQALERQKEDYLLQQKQIRALREFAARQSTWAQKCQDGSKRGRDQRGRVAMKMARRANAAERKIVQIEERKPVEDLRDRAYVSASISAAGRGGQIVFEARGVSKTFGKRKLFSDLDLTIGYGERIGIVGPNGAGKTTLIRLLLGEEPTTSGEVRRGAGVRPLYLAQEQEQLDPAKTILETVEEQGRLSHTEARTLLACFLFRENEVFKKIFNLSGGEKVRLAVACAVVSGANLLVLDEPTNHLDIDTRERLEEAIAAYDGTLIVISHDRFMLDKLAERILVIDEGRIVDYMGKYSEWRKRQTVTQ